MRRIALILTLLAGVAAAFVATAPADDSHTYSIEMYNAFGIVSGSDVRVAGVNAGTVKSLDVNDQKRAVVTVELTGPLSVLGTDTKCSSEPQSLIAEYFIDCDPHGPPIQHSDDPNKPDIPADHVEQTVQNDLVQNTLREPYKRRLQLLINEFGTALAGNPQNLNEAIRLGAPALVKLKKVTHVLGDQNTIIRNLNVDSDHIIGKLNERSQDVVSFIRNARDTAAASAERGNDLSADFGKLDDFLAELKPTLTQLDELAVTQTPVLQDLRGSAGGLDRLMLNLPAFNSATKTSLQSLGDASKVGKRALQQGKDELHLLAESGKKAPATSEILADFLRDIDDPSRSVEQDARAAKTCNDKSLPCYSTGRSAPAGYTGLEGLLNYAYYQAGSLNQYDSIGHMLHFSLYYIFSGPCGNFTTGRDPSTGAVSMPNRAGGTTSTPTLTGPDSTQIADCIGWLGKNQAGVNNNNYNFPPYQGGTGPDSVCPGGTAPAAALALCDPSAKRKSTPTPQRKSKPQSGGSPGGGAGSAGTSSGGSGNGSGLPIPGLPGGGGGGSGGGGGLQDTLDRILGGNGNHGGGLGDLPRRLRDRVRNQGGNGGNGGSGGSGGNAAQDLLDFLLGP
jgi:ABC-type transporter Mla subunit MlaD